MTDLSCNSFENSATESELEIEMEISSSGFIKAYASFATIIIVPPSISAVRHKGMMIPNARRKEIGEGLLCISMTSDLTITTKLPVRLCILRSKRLPRAI